MNSTTRSFLLINLTLIATSNLSAQSPDQAEAKRALKKVVSFYRSKVGYEGAYLWRYAADMSAQEGEGTASKTSGWTQPPGTSSVGEAYLKAWRQSGDDECLEAAVEAATALVRAQLESGGWSSHFDLGPEGRRRYCYHVDGSKAGKNNYTTFDDNKSQSALSLLMHVDEALEFKNGQIHETVEYALEKMLAAQYPNGAWPQQYREPPNPADFPVKKASYPKAWSRTYPKQDYRGFYTLNDNNMSYIIDMLLEAHRIYNRDDCYRAGERTGNFFLLAQMPDPQPGWAQQYDLNMHPAWARKFEPASITGGESQSVMRALIRLYRFTGNKKFVEPLPRALAYYRKSQLPNGQLARFYELIENRPLYFSKDYELTYSDADMPTHYAFKVRSNLDSIEGEYQKAKNLPADELKPEHRIAKPVRLSSRLANRGRSVMKSLDDRGAWVEKGRLRDDRRERGVIEMKTFIRNLDLLSQLAGAK